MWLLIPTTFLLIMQTPQVESLAEPKRRNRKMLYGKSKASFQPFLSKFDDPNSLPNPPNPKAAAPMKEFSGSEIRQIPSADGIIRTKVYESTNSKSSNPVQILAEMNKRRIEAGDTEPLNPIQVLQEINKNRRENTAEKIPSPYPSLSSFENERVGTSEPPNIKFNDLSLQQQQQQQSQVQPPQQQKPALTNRSWQKPKTSSGLANIYWRAVDVDDLRDHPYFNSLPLPDDVLASNAVEYSLFRQDSWQWGALHEGRLTTARAAACCGFYEQESARILKVPRSLSGHSKAVHAYEHLQEPAPQSWDFLNQDYYMKHPEALKSPLENGAVNVEDAESAVAKKPKKKGYQPRPPDGTKTAKQQQKKSDVWISAKLPKKNYTVEAKALGITEEGSAAKAAPSKNGTKFQFPFTYRPKGKNQGSRGYSSASSARMAWGSSQEATAVLVAVNYFQAHGLTGIDSNGEHTHTMVEEAGMFPLEALSDPMPLLPQYSSEMLSWVKDGSLPIIGASPDGMLRHPDGSCEVLEVKCHSPFIETRYYNNNNSSSSNSNNNRSSGGGRDRDSAQSGLSISDRGAADSVATWHIPQLQLHILCAGPSCTGAVLVSLSATKGANIFRVKRDDEYIMRMMTWIRKFYVTYVLPGKKNIPENYFLKEPGYDAFLNSTLKICAEAELVAHVPDSNVQRSPINGNFFI